MLPAEVDPHLWGNGSRAGFIPTEEVRDCLSQLALVVGTIIREHAPKISLKVGLGLRAPCVYSLVGIK